VANYSLFIKPSAAKETEALPKADRLKIVHRIQGLAENPRPQGHVKLSGDDKYRVRQGNYRILYTINGNELIVTLVRVSHRREVFRK
jgi:mRNA interferase RelE/StbE